MNSGDHILVARTGFDHHGIYVGNDQVIHFSGEVASKSNASICRVALNEFASGGKVEVREYDSCDAPDVVVARAESRVGERGYKLLINNCEHFATWCKTGQENSRQVRAARKAATLGAAGHVLTKGLLSFLPMGLPIKLALTGAKMVAGAKLWKKFRRR